MPSLSKVFGILFFLLFSIPVVGSRSPHQVSSFPTRSSDLRALLAQGRTSYASGDIRKAAQLWERGLEISRARKSPYEEAGFLTALGNGYLRNHRYRKAMEIYTAGNDIAKRNGYRDLELSFAGNRASLYRLLGDNAAALQVMESIRPIIGDNPSPGLLLQLAKVAGKAGDSVAAISLFRSAIDAADQQNDPAVQAAAWNQLGYLYLGQKRISEAEVCLVRAFRIRKLFVPHDLPVSYVYLSALRLRQDDAQSALNLIQRATSYGIAKTQIQPPFLFYQRAKSKAALGRLREALADYELAIALAREWRVEVLPADSFRISSEANLQEIYSAYIDTGMRLYAETHDQSLAGKMLAASEENRAVSMREGLREPREFPDEYWEQLGQVRSAISSSLDHPDPTQDQKLADLRLKLSELEARFGLTRRQTPAQAGVPNSFLPGIQRKLGPTEALVSFEWSGQTAYVWAVTSRAFAVSPIHSAGELKKDIAQFRNLLREGDSHAISLYGNRLYANLLNPIASAIAAQHDWLLSLDGPLWELPFAALQGPGGSYLIASHSIRLLPAADLLRSEDDPVPSKGRFVGVADPIYNSADPRFRRVAGAPRIRLQFSRLPGSRTEVEESSGIWQGEQAPVLLLGNQITRPSFEGALASHPAVLHVASHVVQHPSAHDQVLIALGLPASSEPLFLGPQDVASWRHPIGLVVLSGCGSGGGDALPGAGLVGLTRAWLISGAKAVAATYWPIPDSGSPFFQAFYRRLKKGNEKNMTAQTSAEALRLAQNDMLRSGDWKANPAYWSAFFLVGKN